MPTREEAIAELYRRGALSETQRAAVDELVRRGAFTLGEAVPAKSTTRQEAMAELAEEVGPIEAFLVGAGKGFYTVGRGLGLAEPAGEVEEEAMAALKEERPITTGAGEIVGEAAPFIPAAVAGGGIPSLAARAGTMGVLGAGEAATIARGEGQDVLPAAGVGATIGASAEVLFPVIGRLGRKVIQKTLGRVPRGAMLDMAGRPTPELQEALEAAGMSFDDLTQDAIEVISKQKPGAEPAQVARKALFAEEGIPAAKGEITQEFAQRKGEQELLEAAGETAAEPFRQFKLQQSESIKGRMRDLFKGDVAKEETGQLIQDTLTGRRKLLRTQKNDLYRQAAEASAEGADVPIFTDKMAESIPDRMTMERLGILDEAGVDKLNKWLTRFGVKEPTSEMIEKGFVPETLTVENFELFRQGLNDISQSSQAIKNATGPITRALDTEADELVEHLAEKGFGESVIAPLKEARKTVRQLKTEFSPQSIVGRIIDVKKDGVTQITEASKVYDKIIGKAAPIEDVRRLVKSLAKSEKGDQAIASMQASTILDLIDAGFGTESRKISGIKTFNPTAFKRRLKNIGEDKVKAIFANNKAAFKKIKNIDKISGELIPPAGAVPKGSASVILDLVNQLGMVSIATKIPGGAFITGAVQQATRPVKTGAAVRQALKATPDIMKFRTVADELFPGIATALTIPPTIEEEE
jgi:hypothetical protein